MVRIIPLKRPVIVELWKLLKPAWPSWIHLCDVCGFITCFLKKQRLSQQLDEIKDAVCSNTGLSFPCCGLLRCKSSYSTMISKRKLNEIQ